MNLDEAVKAHAGWKMKLSAYLRRPDNSINAAEVGSDNHCPLGQWLHGEAKKTLSSFPEYKTLVAEHARFHRAVGGAVEQANAGKKLDEGHLFGWDSEFAASSRNIVSAVVQLKKKANLA
jgi:methyl-accepting chemotaxis protein